MEITAAVARTPDAPFEIETCELAEPRPGEVRVRIAACGICHTDIAAKQQIIPVALPAVLGHEGAGVVDAVGPGVQGFAAGDHVLMSYASCGMCEMCNTGEASYCFQFVPMNFPGLRLDGTTAISQNGAPISGHFFYQSSFASHAITTPRNLTKVSKKLPLDVLAPLGCGIQTGAGAVIHSLAARPGTSIAVFGVGPVGLSAVMAAKFIGCTTIVAVDRLASRLETASDLGATHTIDTAKTDAATAILELTGGGAHYAFDTTGVPEVCTAAFNCLRPRGTVGYVGASPAGTALSVDMNALIVTGRTVRGIIEGDVWPAEFLPKLVELYRHGALPLDKIVTCYALSEINTAIEDMEAGKVVKPVLVMD
jgi:aryl-alcohol dehydrogenase